MPDNVSLSRRQLLAFIVKFMFVIAIVAFAWVLLASLTFTEQDNKQSPEHFINIDVSALEVSKLRKVSLRHKEVWIYRRSENDIEQLNLASNSLRSQDDNYFVFFPYEPTRNCLVQWNEHDRAFHDPCSGQSFDLAGRRIKRNGSEQDVYLPLPQYHYTSPGQIKIDARIAAIR